MSYYVPYLSAMQLFTPASSKVRLALSHPLSPVPLLLPAENGRRTGKLSPRLRVRWLWRARVADCAAWHGVAWCAQERGGGARLYTSDMEGWPRHMHLKLEHFEQELPFNRHPMYEQLEQLAARTQHLGVAGAAAAQPATPAAAPVPVPAAAVGDRSNAAPDGAAAATPLQPEAKPAEAAAAATGDADGATAQDGRPAGSPEAEPEAGRGGGGGGGGAPQEEPQPAGASGTPADSASRPSAEGEQQQQQQQEQAGPQRPAAASPFARPSQQQQQQGEGAPPQPQHDAPPPRPPGPWLQRARLGELHPASWFCVAWYPAYRIPDAPLNTRFLTFHSFAPALAAIQAAAAIDQQQQQQQATTPTAAATPAAAARQSAVLPLHVVGLKWNNMHGERWLEPLVHVGDGGGGVAAGGGGSEAPTPSASFGDLQAAAAAAAHAPASQQQPPTPGSARAAGGRRGAAGRGGFGGALHGPQHHGGPGGLMDAHLQAHLSELQGTAERMARGLGMRVLGAVGSEECRQRHPDYEFFNSRG